VAPVPAAVPASVVAAAMPVGQIVPAVAGPAGPAPLLQPAVLAEAIYVQAGAYSQYGNADHIRRRLAAIAPTQITPALVGGTEFHRVRLGPFASRVEADRILAEVRQAGVPAQIVFDGAG